MDASPTTTARAVLRDSVAALEASGADRFRPVRFRYIKAMAERSLARNEHVAELVAKKALAALAKYQAEVSRERAAAAMLLQQVAGQQPDMAEQAQALLQAGDFAALRRLATRRQQPPPTTAALTALIRRLDGVGAPPPADQAAACAVSDSLRDRQATAPGCPAFAAAGGLEAPGHAAGELRAARYFRDALQQRHADQLVSRVVREAPEDCGPLNPQKLATRSLQAMRELSPAYLSRFVSYVDTLFWLETA